MNILFTYVCMFVGLLAGSMGMGKLGVEKTLRLSFLLFVISGLLGIFLTGSPLDSYILISAIRGLSGGVFWAAMNFIEMSGMTIEQRSKFYSMSFSSSTLFSVIAPIIIGAVLTFYTSYVPIYLLFSILCMIGAMYPFDFKMSFDTQITKKQLANIFLARRFDGFFYTKMLASFMWMSTWIVSSLIPFLVLGSEFNMGIFLAISSLIAAIISLVTRNRKSKLKLKWGTLLLVLSTIASIPLIFHISLLTLSISWVVSSIAAAIVTPVENEFEVEATTQVTTSKLAFSELVITQEVIYLIARLGLGFITLFLLYFFPLDIVLKTVFATSVLVKVAHYIVAATFVREHVV